MSVRVWNEEKLSIMRAEYRFLGAIPLAVKFGLTPKAVTVKAQKLGLKMDARPKPPPRGPKWTAREVELIRVLYPVGGVEACAPEMTHRTKAAIKFRASKLGVRLEP